MRLFLAAIILAATLTGCATRNYTYQGATYSSEAAALAAHTKHLDALSATLAPRAQISQSVLVVVPDVDRCYAEGCVPKPAGIIDVHSLLYVLKLQVAQYASFASYLHSSGLFARAEAKTVKDPAARARAASGYDVVIYVEHTAPPGSEPTWHVLKNGAEVGTVQLEAGEPAARIERWLNLVAQIAK